MMVLDLPYDLGFVLIQSATIMKNSKCTILITKSLISIAQRSNPIMIVDAN
jgi:hypothetical protein